MYGIILGIRFATEELINKPYLVGKSYLMNYVKRENMKALLTQSYLIESKDHKDGPGAHRSEFY